MKTQIFNVGDKVRHNYSKEVATITARRKVIWNKGEGEVYVYKLDFGKSVKGHFGYEINGGEFRAEAFTLYNSSENKEKAKPSSWVTDFTADDFRKLRSRYEINEEDRDIMGNRYELEGEGLGVLQIFVSDYSGNEDHALYYIWDEWMQEVRANVRPLSYLRQMLTPSRGWHQVAA